MTFNISKYIPPSSSWPLQDGEAMIELSAHDDQVWNVSAEEGKLAVDVAESDTHILIACPMAGAQADRIDISLHQDLLTIRGYRTSPFEKNVGISLVHEECFWGPFSRTIVLPAEVHGDRAEARYQNGVLQITVPKKEIRKKIPVLIVED